MAEDVLISRRSQSTAARLNRLVYHLARRWLLWFSIGFGLFTGLPFLAPVLMNMGLETPARIIYTVYSFLCHQLPQRSYFLFGQQFTYSLADIQQAWQAAGDMGVLRQFIGNPQMGWKVAWSDRMVSMYSGIMVAAWIWYPLRRRLGTLNWRGLILLALPMTADGITHMISDLTNPLYGFRQDNAWLAGLTGQMLSPSFYSGDAWGSFNSLARLVTGFLFALGIVWFGFPYLESIFSDLQYRIRDKFARARLPL